MKAIRDLDDKKRQGFKWAKAIEIFDTKNDIICMTTGNGSRDDLILDSACSFHMCATKELFDRYKSYDAYDIVMVNGSRRKVVCVSTVKMKMFDGFVQTLGDMRYIPNLRKNLVLFNRLNTFGYNYCTTKFL